MATVRHLDLFPFCYPNKKPENENVDFIANSQSASLALFWKIKKFKLFTICFDAHEPPDYVPQECGTIFQRSGSYEDEDENIVTYLIDSEKQLVCGGLDFMAIEDYGEGWSFIPYMKHIKNIEYIENIKETNKKHYYWNILLAFYNAHTAQYAQVQTWYEDTSQWNYSLEEIKLDFGEYNDSFKLYSAVSQNPIGGSLKMNFEVLEFFEYAQQDGKNPIYDKHSGKQLRAFA